MAKRSKIEVMEPLHWMEADLERLCALNDEDSALATKFWRENAGTGANLLDAKPWTGKVNARKANLRLGRPR